MGWSHIGNSASQKLFVKGSSNSLNNYYRFASPYMPTFPNEYDDIDYALMLLPDGIETVSKRFAISWRNKWILRQADYVVTYVTHSWGGAAKFAEMAIRQKKLVINLSKR